MERKGSGVWHNWEPFRWALQHAAGLHGEDELTWERGIQQSLAGKRIGWELVVREAGWGLYYAPWGYLSLQASNSVSFNQFATRIFKTHSTLLFSQGL